MELENKVKHNNSAVKGTLTIVGLGPGASGHLSLETLQLLEERFVILRTEIHPTVAELKRRGISFISCDGWYEREATFEEVYDKISSFVIEQAKEKDVVYAVPGSPLVAERTVVLLREKAKRCHIPLTVKPAMSFLDLAYVELGIDPIDGLRIIDAQDFSALSDAGQYPLMVTQVYNQMVASDMKLALMDILPDETKVYFLRNLGLEEEECRKVPLFEIDRQPVIDHLTSVFIPRQPQEVLQSVSGNEKEEERTDIANEAGHWKRFPLLKRKTEFDVRPLADVMQVLREPGGCPWDREQDFDTIRANLIEECYEFLEAVDDKDTHGMAEELGDILMQVVFHSRMAEEKGMFTLQDVIDGVTDKLIERHPHVFGTVKVANSEEVLTNWDAIKLQEKPERKRVLDGIYKGLPSLLRAHKIQRRVAKVGFDWTETEDVKKKVLEEWNEFNEAVDLQNPEEMEKELGDLYFSMVNFARHLGLDSETALNRCNNRFVTRFEHVEDCVTESGKDWKEYSLDELDRFWDEAKINEKSND
jgi:tetrapyrrole methylase family protein/MazG family protein